MYVLGEIARNVHGLCDIEAVGFGYDDHPTYSDTFAVYFKLNQDLPLSVSDVYDKRGIHIGLVNISSCSLMGEPCICDIYSSSQGNECVKTTVEAYTNNDKDLVIILTTGVYI